MENATLASGVVALFGYDGRKIIQLLGVWCCDRFFVMRVCNGCCNGFFVMNCLYWTFCNRLFVLDFEMDVVMDFCNGFCG